MEAGGPRPAALSNRLSASAKRNADEVGLRLDTSGQDYLGGLVSNAVEYLLDHPEAPVERAEESFARLAANAASLQQQRTAAVDTLLPQRPSELNAEDLHLAALGLCPGFFPFC